MSEIQGEKVKPEYQWIDSGGKVLHYGHIFSDTMFATICPLNKFRLWRMTSKPDFRKSKCKLCLKILEAEKNG